MTMQRFGSLRKFELDEPWVPANINLMHSLHLIFQFSFRHISSADWIHTKLVSQVIAVRKYITHHRSTHFSMILSHVNVNVRCHDMILINQLDFAQCVKCISIRILFKCTSIILGGCTGTQNILYNSIEMRDEKTSNSNNNSHSLSYKKWVCWLMHLTTRNLIIRFFSCGVPWTKTLTLFDF